MRLALVPRPFVGPNSWREVERVLPRRECYLSLEADLLELHVERERLARKCGHRDLHDAQTTRRAGVAIVRRGARLEVVPEDHGARR